MKKNLIVLQEGNKDCGAASLLSIIRYYGGDISLDRLVEMTKDNTGGIFNICLNYGGRAEIVDATKKMINEGINSNDITEDSFKKYLYQDLPDVDLLIRTSGEIRLSNFLLWELSYAEFYFTPIKFPAFTRSDFDDAIIEYTRRDRRFGGIKE